MNADFLSRLEGFLEEPRAALASLEERPSIALGIFLYGVSAATVFVAEQAAGRSALFDGSFFGLTLACSWEVLKGLIVSSSAHFFAEFLGGRGRSGALFVSFGFCQLGGLVVLPAFLIAGAMLPPSSAAFGLISFLVWTCVMVLRLRSLEGLYGLSRGRAAAALAAPYALFAAAAVSGSLVGLWGLASAITEAFS